MTVDGLGRSRAPAASPSTSTAPTTPTAPRTARRLVDDDFLVLVNGWWEPLTFTIPDLDGSRPWQRELDSYDPAAVDGARRWRPAAHSPSARVRSSSCAAPAEATEAGAGSGPPARPSPTPQHRSCPRIAHPAVASKADMNVQRRGELRRLPGVRG